MQRILVLNYEFPPLGGGAGNATYYLLREFAKTDDLQIDVVTSSTDTFRIEQFSENITIHFLDIGKKGSLHYQSTKDLLAYSWKAYFYCKKLKEGKKFDLVHAFFGIPCGYIAMKLGVPYIVSLRGSDVPGHNPKFYWLDKVFFRKLSKKIWRRAEGVITNSDDLVREAKETEGAVNFVTIPNGVDTSFFIPGEKTKSDMTNLLYVGRLSIVKGLDYLFRALSEISSENIHLRLVGGGDREGHLRNLSEELGISEKVVFSGVQGRDALVKIYNQSHIFILPSLNEGMSNTILEAMACGLPVIATNTGGAAELIQGNGIVVPKADVAALREAIEQLISDRGRAASMGRKSRELAERMSWAATATEYQKVYLSCNR